MLDRNEANRPERRSTIISCELAKYDINIAALSEVRFPDSGNFREESSDTFCWSGRPSGLKREAGVALAISNRLTAKPVNERIITLRLPFPRTDSAW